MVGKAMAPVVQLRAAVALAGRFPALAGVDLSVETGEVVLVVGAGPSGLFAAVELARHGVRARRRA